MSGTNTTGSFSSFLQRSVDKVSSSKVLKFISNNPQDDNDPEYGTTSSLSKREHRRAQVRKAQIEHRQRKENHVKNLEQEIINLRDMISAAELQAGFFKCENDAIKDTLNEAKLLPKLQDIQPHINPPTFQETNFNQTLPSQQGGRYHPNYPSNTLVSATFDEFIDSTCLHLIPGGTFGPGSETIVNSPDIFNFPINTSTPNALSMAPEWSHLHTDTSKPLPLQPGQSNEFETSDYHSDLSTKAINFILALEHPCRTHFRPKEDVDGIPNSPEGYPSGHELMASTYLYTHAPPTVFSAICSSPSSTPWMIPSSPTAELTKLHQMSESLSKEDWEITPVQAWFLLVGRLGVKRLTGKTGRDGKRGRALERLKTDLAKLVDCFGFGAVMNEALFWKAVETFLEEESKDEKLAAAEGRYEGDLVMS